MNRQKWVAVKTVKLRRRNALAELDLNSAGREGQPCVRVRTHDGGRPRAKDGYIEELSERCADELDRIQKKRALILRLRSEGYGVVNESTAATHSVYVIRLDEAVRDQPKARNQNPGASASLPCYYVGQTSKTPEERLQQHRSGEKASYWVREFTKDPSSGLAPELYEGLNPMPRDEALEREASLADSLRTAGHVVMGGH